MAKKSANRNPTPANQTGRAARPRIFLGLFSLIVALLTAIAVMDYRPEQNHRFSTQVTENNMVGEFGATFAYYSILWTGLSAWLVPVWLVWFSFMFFASYSNRLNWRKYLAIIFFLVSTAVLGSILQAEVFDGTAPTANPNFFPFGMGGWLGQAIYEDTLRSFLGTVGTLVVFGVTLVFSLGVLLGDNLLADFFRWAGGRLGEWKAGAEERRRAREERKALLAARKAEEKKRRQEAEAERKAAKERAKEKAKQSSAPVSEPPSALPAAAVSGKNTSGVRPLPTIPREVVTPPAKASRKFEPMAEEQPPESPPVLPVETARASLSLRRSDKTDEPVVPGAGKVAKPAVAETSAGDLKIIAGEQVRKANIKLPEKRGNHVFPPFRLLAEPVVEEVSDTSETHRQMAELLVKTLEEFGVRVTMGEVHTGPVITRYDVYPAPGVKVEKIESLDKNLALSLKALSVRILAPVPGKGCVGIEVPNKKPQSVFIRDILESEDWANTKAEIPIALGKEVSGKPLIADLTKMPHLLIAGSTGSGKTVCINSIITSLLYHASPEDIRFVMVDPKIVEMQVYNVLPHMLVPVVTDPKKVPNALKYLLNEMEKRYHLFASIGVRNIAGYNAKMSKSRKDAAEAEALAAEMDASLTPEERAASASIQVPREPDLFDVKPEKLPYIVCIVDELADLMMVAPADIETGIARLAQLARAAGIHLILATQRPSVNVITGVIKANLPSRISFKVASKVDSRTILDTGGADQLIGRGDMLFLPPGSADLVRSQGAFVGDDEITGIVEYIAEKNGEPLFDEQFQRNIETGEESADGENGDDWDDELVPQAIEVIKTSKRASTSMLQRRLKIGYNRAARIMELLEAEGMVGPENGSSPREILMDLD